GARPVQRTGHDGEKLGREVVHCRLCPLNCGGKTSSGSAMYRLPILRWLKPALLARQILQDVRRVEESREGVSKGDSLRVQLLEECALPLAAKDMRRADRAWRSTCHSSR